MKTDTDTLDSLRSALAASQEREGRLVDALEECRADLVALGEEMGFGGKELADKIASVDAALASTEPSP